MIRYPRIFGVDPSKRVFPAESLEEGRRSAEPATTMDRWIGAMIAQHPLAESDRGVDVASLGIRHPAQAAPRTRAVGFEHGKLVREGAYLPGGTGRTQMWQGMLRRSYLRRASDNINRFVPGRTGRGFTDDLDTVVLHLQQRGQAGLYHFPALWYERRRDDHGRMMRADAEVWAPFLEQPFARSGEGQAYDRLSRYDLDRPNPWYWSRIAGFCARADAAGLYLVSEHYLQHNIIEEGAHWADYPWRSANNVNDLGFAEETYYQADKSVFMAEQFYDDTNPVLRRLHRKYIRMCLEQLKARPNVVHLVSAEYTGPLHFTRFWLQTIAEWEAETGLHPLVALSCTKDVQDALLQDSVLAGVVDVIDIRYWHYNQEGLWAPEGGKNMAPRQWMRKMKVGKTGFEEAYRAVLDYRERYPGKAVTFYSQQYPDYGWAVLMAGGSLPNVRIGDTRLLEDLAAMTPREGNGYKLLGNADRGYLVYKTEVHARAEIPTGTYDVYAVDTRSGEVILSMKSAKIAASYAPEHTVTWLRKR